MTLKTTYAIQPYHVGRRDNKSLAVVIPAKLVREYSIDTSTIFAVKTDKQNKSLTLQMIDVADQNRVKPTTERTLESFGQQVSVNAQEVKSR